ncbi:MAG: hypothetical protein GXY82_10330 [Methanospirillum sp.]|nr:hypothetical protein [Methanospirillum sp.]
MNRQAAWAAVIGGAVLVLLVAVTVSGGTLWPAASPPAGSAGIALWEGRWTEVLYQGLLLLSGVLAILLLIGPVRREP